MFFFCFSRKYVNGHLTNAFAKDREVHWYRDPGGAAAGPFFAKKVG